MTFGDSFDGSLDNILDSDISESDISDDKIYISLLINQSLSTQSKDLDAETIANFNVMRSSAFLKLDTDKSQPYVQ